MALYDLNTMKIQVSCFCHFGRHISENVCASWNESDDQHRMNMDSDLQRRLLKIVLRCVGCSKLHVRLLEIGALLNGKIIYSASWESLNSLDSFCQETFLIVSYPR